MNRDCPLLIIGAGGHAAVLAEIIKLSKRPVVGVIALQEQHISGFAEYPYLGADATIEQYDPTTIQLINAVGAVSVQSNHRRDEIFKKYKQMGYSFATLIHPSAVIASTASIGEGAQIMAGVVIQPNVIVGNNTIINTRASIDHDCQIGESVHIAPGAILSGNIVLGRKSHIGVGATLIQGLTIGDEVMVCAGATIISKIPSAQKVMGVY